MKCAREILNRIGLSENIYIDTRKINKRQWKKIKSSSKLANEKRKNLLIFHSMCLLIVWLRLLLHQFDVVAVAADGIAAIVAAATTDYALHGEYTVHCTGLVYIVEHCAEIEYSRISIVLCNGFISNIYDLPVYSSFSKQPPIYIIWNASSISGKKSKSGRSPNRHLYLIFRLCGVVYKLIVDLM